jgi:hypothetical protein
MAAAVRAAVVCGPATKEKRRGSWGTNRPSAGLIRELHERLALLDWDIEIEPVIDIGF